MKENRKLSKVNQTVGLKKRKITKKLTEAEREERIQYLVDLFRLSFRTTQQFGNTFEELHPDDYYDSVVDCAIEQTAGFGYDDEMEDFRADFQALDAEDRFNQCCIDYYEDVLTETKMRIEGDERRLRGLRAEMKDETLILDKKTRRSNLKEQARLEERIELNRTEQIRTEQKLQKFLKSIKITTDEKVKD